MLLAVAASVAHQPQRYNLFFASAALSCVAERHCRSLLVLLCLLLLLLLFFVCQCRFFAAVLLENGFTGRGRRVVGRRREGKGGRRKKGSGIETEDGRRGGEVVAVVGTTKICHSATTDRNGKLSPRVLVLPLWQWCSMSSFLVVPLTRTNPPAHQVGLYM